MGGHPAHRPRSGEALAVCQKNLDVVLPDRGIQRHEPQPLDLGLRHQHPVEWVLVVAGQFGGRDRVVDRDRKLDELILCDRAAKIGGRLEAAERTLRRDLRRRGSADEDDGGAAYGRARACT